MARTWARTPYVVLMVIAVAGAALITLPGTANPEPAPRTIGNHSLSGVYEFHADGVVEVNDEPTRGFWEVGRFEADGRGNMLNGVEYSSLLSSSDESLIDQNFTFAGTYQIRPDGTGTADVTVQIPGGSIQKRLWLVVHSIGPDGIARGFSGGHADADLGGGTHGNARVHEGSRIGPGVRRG